MISNQGLDKKLHDELKGKLSVLQSEIEGKTQQEIERKRSVRYHKVKFFERRKVERKIETVTKKLSKEKDEDSARALRQELVGLEDDLTYVMYFPKAKKYVSLFAEHDEKSTKKLNALRKEARDAKEIARANLAAVGLKTKSSSDLKRKASAQAEEEHEDVEKDVDEDNGDEDEDNFFVEEPDEAKETIQEEDQTSSSSSSSEEEDVSEEEVKPRKEKDAKAALSTTKKYKKRKV